MLRVSRGEGIALTFVSILTSPDISWTIPIGWKSRLPTTMKNISFWTCQDRSSYTVSEVSTDFVPLLKPPPAHFPLVSRIASLLQQWDFHLCGVYLLESQFIQDRTKFFAGVLSAMSAMISLEIPHINVISKMDLIKEGQGGVRRRMELER